MLCFHGELKLFSPFWKEGDLYIINIKPYLLTHHGKGLQLEKVSTTPLAKMASCQSWTVFKLCHFDRVCHTHLQTVPLFYNYLFHSFSYILNTVFLFWHPIWPNTNCAFFHRYRFFNVFNNLTKTSNPIRTFANV